MPGPEDLLAFWFGDEPLVGEALDARMRTWFSADPTFDAELRARFAPLADEAARARSTPGPRARAGGSR
jgi:uncharacterized protein (DUF924 family)